MRKQKILFHSCWNVLWLSQHVIYQWYDNICCIIYSNSLQKLHLIFPFLSMQNSSLLVLKLWVLELFCELLLKTYPRLWQICKFLLAFGLIWEFFNKHRFIETLTPHKSCLEYGKNTWSSREIYFSQISSMQDGFYNLHLDFPFLSLDHFQKLQYFKIRFREISNLNLFAAVPRVAEWKNSLGRALKDNFEKSKCHCVGCVINISIGLAINLSSNHYTQHRNGSISATRQISITRAYSIKYSISIYGECFLFINHILNNFLEKIYKFGAKQFHTNLQNYIL